MDELMTLPATIPQGGRADLLPAAMEQIDAVARLLASAGAAVPVALQGNVDLCRAVAFQAADWGLSPLAVAKKVYVVPVRAKVREEGRAALIEKEFPQIAYEAQLIMSLVNTRAPLARPLQYTFEGQGATLVCICTGWLKDATEPSVYRSPTFGQLKVKNSPLYYEDPQQQMAYRAGRSWARRFCPEVILGIYAPDELQRVTDDGAPRPAEALYADEPDGSQEAEFEDHSPEPAGDAGRKADQAEPADEGAGAAALAAATDPQADLPDALKDATEPDGAEEDRAWLADKHHQIMGNTTLGRPDGADVWAELLFTSRRFRRVIAYQQPLANVVRAAIEDHLARLKAAMDAGADPNSGELFGDK